MYKYVKSDLDSREVRRLGLLDMWKSAQGRNSIISEVKRSDASDIVDLLEQSLDDDEFKNVILTIASAMM